MPAPIVPNPTTPIFIARSLDVRRRVAPVHVQEGAVAFGEAETRYRVTGHLRPSIRHVEERERYLQVVGDWLARYD
jgi:hypothetical protein